MHNRSVVLDVKKAGKHNVVMLFGPEPSLRREALLEILALYDLQPDDIDIETTLADERTPAEWIASASAIPFMGSKRVVVVRNLLRLDPKIQWPDHKAKLGEHPFVDELASLPNSSLLVLVADSEVGDEDRQRRLAPICERWSKLVVAGKGYPQKLEHSPEEIRRQLRAKAKAMGKSLSATSASLLAEMTGGNLTVALEELNKAALYVGDEKQISDQDLLRVVAAEQDYNVYKLVDSIVAGTSGQALSQLRTLYSRQSRIEGQTFSRVFPTIARQFRLIWQARLCIEANCSTSNPSRAVLEMLPVGTRISDQREWLQRKASQAARRLSLRKIARVFNVLQRADSKMKGLRPSFTNQETVEDMVLRLASICRA